MKFRLFIVFAIVALVVVSVPVATAEASSASCYTVKPGDTLSSIAARYGVSISAIMNANGLVNADLIFVGQCLAIPGSSTPKPPSGCTSVYIVKRGDYLKLIAARYHTTIAALVDLNNLRNPNLIYPGQRLKLPCAHVTPPAPPTPGTGVWKGLYWANRLFSGNPKFTRNSSAIDFNWGSGGPGGGVGPDNFSIRWTSTQRFDAGKYRFHVQVDDGARLWVDGVLLIDQWRDEAVTEYTADKQLTAGNHALQLDYYEHTGVASIKFWVERLDVVPSSAWLAEYFGNRMFEPPALITRLEPSINYDWGTGAPFPNFRPDDFAVRWTRNINFAGGTYRFTVTVDDGVEILLDGQPILSEWHDSSGATYVKDVYISPGTHRVRVKYYEAGGNAKIIFNFAKAPVGPQFVFTGEYFNNVNAQGTTVLVRQDNGINFNWGNKSPAPGVTADYFSVEWNGTFFFEAGTYRFTATMDDGMKVLIDKTPVIDQWHDGAARTVWVDVYLTEGNHWINVDYYERTGQAVAKLSWTKR